jgi:hypothetical protein
MNQSISHEVVVHYLIQVHMRRKYGLQNAVFIIIIIITENDLLYINIFLFGTNETTTFYLLVLYLVWMTHESGMMPSGFK